MEDKKQETEAKGEPMPEKQYKAFGIMANVIKRLESLEEKSKRLEEENRFLKEIADKSRLAYWMQKNPYALKKEYKLSTINGKAILAWRTITNEVFQDQFGRSHEKQIIELTTEDGEKHTMPYIDFARQVQKVECEFVSRAVTADGYETYKLKAPNGKTYEVDIAFVNETPMLYAKEKYQKEKKPPQGRSKTSRKKCPYSSLL